MDIKEILSVSANKPHINSKLNLLIKGNNDSFPEATPNEPDTTTNIQEIAAKQELRNAQLKRYINQLENILKEFQFAIDNKLNSLSLYQTVITDISYIFNRIYSEGISKDTMHESKGELDEIFNKYEPLYKGIITGLKNTPVTKDMDYTFAVMPLIHLASGVLGDVRNLNPNILIVPYGEEMAESYKEFFSDDLFWLNFYSDTNNLNKLVDFSIPFLNTDYIKSSDFKDKELLNFHKWLKELYVNYHELNYYENTDKLSLKSLKNIMAKCNRLLGRFFKLRLPDGLNRIQGRYLLKYQDLNTDMSGLASWDEKDVLKLKNKLSKLIINIFNEISEYNAKPLFFSNTNINDLFLNTIIATTPDKYINPNCTPEELTMFSAEAAIQATVGHTAPVASVAGQVVGGIGSAIGNNIFKITSILSLTMMLVGIGSKVYNSIKIGKMNKKSLKNKLVELKEHNDKLFKAKVDPEIDAIINKYRSEYETFINTEYKEKIDSLFMEDLKKLFNFLFRLDKKINKEVSAASKKLNAKHFSIDPEGFIDNSLELVLFSMNSTLAHQIENSINSLSVYSTGGKPNIVAYKKALMNCKRTIDKFFNIKVPEKMEGYFSKLEDQYQGFLNNVYDKKAGSDKIADLKAIHEGLDKIGDYAITILKESNMANFSENSINTLKQSLASTVLICNHLFDENKFKNKNFSELVNHYKGEYSKFKDGLMESLNKNDLQVLNNYSYLVSDFIDKFKEEAQPLAPFTSFINFSERISDKNIILNFSKIEAKNEVVNTLRLIFKEIPEIEKAPELHQAFLTIQQKFFDEPLGSFDGSVLGKKLEDKQEFELQQINEILRSFLREIRNFNKGTSILAKTPNSENKTISNFREYKGNRKYENNEADWNKLERFFISAGKNLKQNIIPATAGALGIGLTIKKLKG